MGQADTFIRRRIGQILLAGALAWAGLANATDVRFVGSVGISGASTIILLNADRIQNFGSSTSGALRMELWATPAPFAGSFSGGHQMAAHGLAPLAAGASHWNVSSGALPYSAPPGGTWQVTMVLTEQAGAATNGGYVARNWLGGFPPITGTGPPPPDTTPPTASIASPTGGNVSGTVTVTANASDNVGVTRVDFYVNGSLAGSDSSAPYQYPWNTTALPNGSATLYAKAFDAADNSAQSATVTVNVLNGPPPDTTPPTATIASPTGGNVSGTVTVTANASDNVGVTRVDFYVNGSLAGSDSSAPYQYAWNTTALPNGSATLYAKAFDAAGNSAQSATVTVNVLNGPPPDTTPPTAAIASPTGGNVSSTVTVTANASDNVGVTRVDFYVNGSLAGSDSSAPYQYAWNTTALPNGSATLYAKAFDAADNSAQSATVTVNVLNGPPPDTTPPTAAIASPTGGNVSGTVTVTANASDNVGVTRVDFYVNGSLAGSDSSAPYQYAWNTTALPNGSATLYAKAFDAADNSAQSATVTVNVLNGPPPDTTPPTAAIASPTGGNVSGTVTVTANASDNVGVTRLDFYVNGSLAGSDSSAPYQYAWNTTALPNGSATLYAKAFDAAGNSAQSTTVGVTVANVAAPPPDTTPPTASIASPTGGIVAGVVTISANAGDNVGVTRVDFYVNGVLAGSDAAPPYQYTWNTTVLADGPATVYAKAFDAAGNLAQSATVAVTVANAIAPPPDVSPPVVTLLSPNGGYVSGQVSVTASATDNVGVARVDLLVNGAVVGSAAMAPWSFTWNSRSVGDGATQIWLAAVDAAGNRATSAAVTVTVANGGGTPLKFALEYYNAHLDHYFMTAMDEEVSALDAGRFAGWYRTGFSFNVYAPGTADGKPVCRFYLPPAYGDSHFYSAMPAECEQVAQKFPDFVYESTEVFRVDTPDLDTGQCPQDKVPVYRLWNNRVDSNHRYTTDRVIRDHMVAKGYVVEGYGPDPVVMCASR